MSKVTSSTESFFDKYSSMIFTILSAVAISITIFFCYTSYINSVSVDGETSQSQVPTTFDQKTVKNIQDLHSRDSNPSFNPPSNQRINPFME